MDSFAERFTNMAREFRQATGLALIWKDADPAAWLRLAPAISQHGNPFCRAVKHSTARRLACCAADNVRQDPHGDGLPHRRRCPFGLIEIAVPCYAGSDYQGCCYVGGWRGRSAPSVEAGTAAGRAYHGLPFFDSTRACAAGALAARLMRDLLHLRSSAPAAEVVDPRIAEAIRHVDERLYAGLRAKQVAAAVHLSPSRFVHLFKDETGRPFTAFLQERLMRRAALLLARPDCSITQTALDLGYDNPAYFSTAFRRYHGLPPRQWQERLQAAGE